jgi:hypothetical protein
MSESEPCDDASLKTQGTVKTGGVPYFQDKPKRDLYGFGGSRCKAGISSAQALVWNVRTLFRMRREMTNG